jgi:cytochrome c biogenesis protein CcmG/thiol:disulfide interchange protein DsbE
MKTRLPLFIFFGLLLLLAIGLTRNPQNLPSPLINQSAPELVLPDLFNGTAHQSTTWQGKPWVLTVWASWCSSCMQEHQVLQQLKREQPDLKLVGLDYKDDIISAQHWLKQYGNPFDAVLVDAQGQSAIDWGVYGVPETFIIDKHNLIRHKITGALTTNRLQQEILPLLQTLAQEP